MKKLISAFFLVVLSTSAMAGHHAKDGHKDIVDTAASNEMFSTLVTADDVKKGKPDPETFLRAALEMGIEPEKCVVFEDTEMGKQAALDGGMACIMVENGRVVGDIARKG